MMLPHDLDARIAHAAEMGQRLARVLARCGNREQDQIAWRSRLGQKLDSALNRLQRDHLLKPRRRFVRQRLVSKALARAPVTVTRSKAMP